MTLGEKIGQMCQVDGREDPEYWVKEKHVGSLLHVIGEVTNELQQLAADSRLGIPLLFGIDAIHGHAFWPAATVFPTQLALACSWNPNMLVAVGLVDGQRGRTHRHALDILACAGYRPRSPLGLHRPNIWRGIPT